MVRVNTSNTNPESTGGNYIDAEGKFHCIVDDIRVFDDKVEMDYSVLNGPAGQAGKQRKGETFWLTEKAMSRLLRFACAVGLYTTAQWKADRDAGADTDIQIEDAVGRDFCVDIKLVPGKKDPTKKFAEFGFDIHAVGDDAAADCPKCPKTLAIYKGKLPKSDGTFREVSGGSGGGSGGNGGGSSGQPAKPSPRPTQPASPARQPATAGAAAGGNGAATGDDEFGNLF